MTIQVLLQSELGIFRIPNDGKGKGLLGKEIGMASRYLYIRAHYYGFVIIVADDNMCGIIYYNIEIASCVR